MNCKVKLVLIHQGNDEEAIGPALARWASMVIAQRAEFECCLLDTSERRTTLAQLTRADAFLILASEQSHGYSAELKAFIDRAPIRWQARPVAFIGYGGASGGMSAIAQLRQVLAEQHAVPICSVVTLPDPWALLDEEGAWREPDQARVPMARMLVLLNWWAIALRNAREQTPYQLVSQ